MCCTAVKCFCKKNEKHLFQIKKQSKENKLYGVESKSFFACTFKIVKNLKEHKVEYFTLKGICQLVVGWFFIKTQPLYVSNQIESLQQHVQKFTYLNSLYILCFNTCNSSKNLYNFFATCIFWISNEKIYNLSSFFFLKNKCI